MKHIYIYIYIHITTFILPYYRHPDRPTYRHVRIATGDGRGPLREAVLGLARGGERRRSGKTYIYIYMLYYNMI